MSKLFWVNLRRMLRDKTFWTGCVFMAGLGIYLPILYYVEEGRAAIPNNYFFTFNLLMGIFAAVFCSLYLGTEYSERTIHNKLIAGHTRRNIYLANLIICTLASLAVMLLHVAAESIVGMPLLGRVQMDVEELLIRFLASTLMILAFTSIFTLRSMLSHNKASASVINIMLFLALFILALAIDEKLQQPEFLPFAGHMDELGNMVWDDNIPNPKYLQGTSRAVYEFIDDFLPTAQGIQMCWKALFRWGRMALCDVGITVVTTVLGLHLFERKDIK